MSDVTQEDYDKPKYFGDDGLAKALGVARITVFRLRKSKKLNYFILGKNRIAFSQKHLDEYLSASEIRPVDEI